MIEQNAEVPPEKRIAAKEPEAGCCFVNDNVRSDSRLPFAEGVWLRSRTRRIRHSRGLQYQDGLGRAAVVQPQVMHPRAISTIDEVIRLLEGTIAMPEQTRPLAQGRGSQMSALVSFAVD
ncbi:hypothetical protein [Bradyrhizobium pachyrhizi]|uniref:hypothetical protein n=1 Tax=Bradyrhizobium pachyrhizi TaxID=280333 RepID=UPI003D359EB8